MSSDSNHPYHLSRHRALRNGNSTAVFPSSEYDTRIEESTSLRNNNSETLHPYPIYGNTATHTNESWSPSNLWYITPSYPFADRLFVLRIRGPDGELSFFAKHEPTSVISLFPMHVLVSLGWRFNEQSSPREIFWTNDVYEAECSSGSYRPRQFVRGIQISRGMGRNSPFLTKVGLIHPLPEHFIGPNGEMLINRTEYDNAWNFGYIIVGSCLWAELESHTGIYDTDLV
ncbi:hypothetical protein LIA77_01885 [Sarocladium implicatum]|nr:hypothetical protein LIA77_01885 [Sarocladium implicatum]